MAETKVGISQINRPAPLWYRRLSNGLILFIIPGAIGLVQSWGLSDHLANRWLTILGFIPAVLKGIGVMLGNGQSYTTEKTAAILIACMLLASCKSAERLASERAAREEKARQEHMQLLEEMRKQYPCAPAQVLPGKTVYVPGPTLPCPQHGDSTRRDSVKCPDSGFRVDTVKVLDSAWLQLYRDSLASERYGGDIARQDANDQAKRADKAEASLQTAKEDVGYWRRIVLIGGAVLAMLAGGVIFIKIKGLI